VEAYDGHAFFVGTASFILGIRTGSSVVAISGIECSVESMVAGICNWRDVRTGISSTSISNFEGRILD